ncbi:MAG: hypothetical protein KDJ77_11725 [Rhodobiaceae bacterium]|nr:hypothetical protein [Rhodobiaceae bacterium]
MLPWPLLFALAALAVAIAAVLAYLKVRGTGLRALAMVALAIALMNPILKREDREPLPSTVAVVVDESASQRIAGRTDETEAQAERLMDVIGRIPGLTPLRVDVRDGQDGAEGTRLFSALDRALANVPSGQIAGAVMVTDGLVHDIPADAARLGFNAPVHALITGDNGQHDRRIVPHRLPRYGIVGQEQTLEFRVEDAGVPPSDGPPPRVEVIVSRDGEPVSVVKAPLGELVTVPVEITHGGQNVVTLDAAPLDGEVTQLNNQVVVGIEGIRENLRVLLVSGEPHAGERTWRNLLKSDASVDLVHFTILRPPEKQDGTPINQLSLIAFPTRELFSEKIDDFDLIIFDRYQRRGVLPLIYFDNISEYVQNGGAVLVASGPDYASQRSLFRTPLAGVLPAEPTGTIYEAPYRATLSEEGKRHPVTRDLPGSSADPPLWSRWFRLIDSTALSGNTVMEGPDHRPLLILDRVGKGRVALMLSDHAWLWARGFEGGGPHVPLLRRLAHWLMAEPDLEEERLTMHGSGDRVIVERQTMGDTPGDVTITAPDGTEQQAPLESVAPGLWQAELPQQGPGLYRARNGDVTTMASIGPANPREFSEVVSSGATMQPIAEATGGTVIRLADVTAPRVVPIRGASRYFGRDWIGVKAADQYVVTGIRTFPLFAGFLGLALLLGLLAGTWYREGR